MEGTSESRAIYVGFYIKVLCDNYYDLANKTETSSMSLNLFIWGPLKLRLI